MTDNRRVERKFMKEMKDGNSEYWQWVNCDYNWVDEYEEDWIKRYNEQLNQGLQLAKQWLEEQGTNYKEYFPYIVELKQDIYDYMKWLENYKMNYDYIFPILDVMEESSIICFKDKKLAMLFKMRFQ